MQSILSYNDETDKAYGLAGSTITLVAADGEHYLAAIDLDADPADAISLITGFGIKANPRMSAKIIWTQAVKELRVSSLIALGNVVCRAVHNAHRQLSAQEESLLRDVITEEASSHCELDSDEAAELFDSNLEFVERLFNHPSIAGVVRSFAATISSRRHLSGAEAIEILASLGLR